MNLSQHPHVVARVAIKRDRGFHADLKVLTGPCRRPSDSEIAKPTRSRYRYEVERISLSTRLSFEVWSLHENL